MSRALKRLQQLLGPGELRLDERTRKEHAGDKWFATGMPEAVALPRSVAAVSRILKHASRNQIPVTARGAGFGYVGGCVPLRGGIALSLTRLRRIKEISGRDFVAVVQPGVITATLQERVESVGLYYPPDPASRSNCSIGGNIATNAGGPRSVKYGVTRDYVLGLQVVLASGDMVRFGGRTHKDATGFDFARLFTGSEGLLGVVTEATLKLLPLPPYRAGLSVGFKTMKAAARTVRALFAEGFLPSAVELADEFTLAAARDRTGTRMFGGCKAHLIVEMDGQESSVRSELRGLERLAKGNKPVFLRRALGAVACEKVWAVRREFSYSLRDTGLTKINQDVVVPRGQVEALFQLASRLQRRHGMAVACFGHAGDGNIHVNLMLDESKPGFQKRCNAALDELFKGVLDLGGSITGEHGVGIAKKPWWPLAVSQESRAVHRAVKKALDPKGILNPGKFV
ncbi:MAG: FAD/FMN-containing dehydrogenase [Verrucomicrobiales bacterium]|nr:FAD/FMN-containing dehydrogenase [Verrucomicrobiales bacterium]|tara:strand:+ start:33082 stop:34449 length:1368 start_codon:yes stop_codon:yes gene_type:complete